MPSIARLSAGIVVASIAPIYLLFLKDLFVTLFGVGRVVQTIDEFPYTCRRLVHPKLEACEDMWLDDEERALYAACAGTQSRLHWSPAVNKVRINGRKVTGSELIKLHIDEPGEDGLFNPRVVQVSGYTGSTSENALDLLGFDAQIIDNDVIRFYFVNLNPPTDAAGKVLDASKSGANATVEVFQMNRGIDRMDHLRTVSSPVIHTPNRIAPLDDGSFYFTNDHASYPGIFHDLELLTGGGNIAYCDKDGECRELIDGTEESQVPQFTSTDSLLVRGIRQYMPRSKLRFPNGLTRGQDGLLYVPSSVDGQIRVYSINEDITLKQIDSIHTGIPLDNISPDAKGDMYVPGFPKALQMLKVSEDPYKVSSPVTIFRIRKTGAGNSAAESSQYTVEKILEDRDSEVLSAATTVRHDAKTGRLFISGVLIPFLAVCDPK